MKTQRKNFGEKLFGTYQNVVLIISVLTFLLFILWYIPENLPNWFTSNRMADFKSITLSLMQFLTMMLFFICVIHVLYICVKALITKHSIIWLIKQQAVPLVFPILIIVLIKLFNGQLDNELKDLAVGVCGGIVSSIIVLVLDRDNRLVGDVMKHIAWEYDKEGGKTKVESKDV